MEESLELTRTVHSFASESDQVSVAADYWRTRGFEVSVTDAGGLHGERTKSAGRSRFAYVLRMPAKLDVVLLGESTVRVKMQINTRFHLVAETHHAFFRLEMLEFQSVLQLGRKLGGMWSCLARLWGFHSLLWTYELGKLPRNWVKHLAQLEAATWLPAEPEMMP